VLLENDRDEWEPPRGRLESGEALETCLAREFAEELGAVVVVAGIIDCWVTRFCLGAWCHRHLPSGAKRRDAG
jgi:8-oxo-dGTP pyrophosphatase MutT (NUDIX family)